MGNAATTTEEIRIIMSTKTYIRTSLYLVLIWVGYLVGEYPAVPSFNLLGYHHEQPPIDQYDKGISILLLVWSLVLLIKFWDKFWIRISMVFITWGMVGNALDELTGKSGLFSTGEQVALLMALLTTSILIYRWKKK